MNLAALRWLLIALCGLTACRPDMYNQPRSKSLGPSDFFQDGAASRPPPDHTVARGQLHADTIYYTGMSGTNLIATLPMQVTTNMLDRGRDRFNIYCSVCHGLTGEGNGMVVQRGFPPPPSYLSDRLLSAPVGHFYDVITRGYGIMYSYATRVKPEDRWAIAAYIRALQLSGHATLQEVPPEERAKLEASHE